MPEESAYAHLGNAEQILVLLLAELPPGTCSVTVNVEELHAILRRIAAARAVIHRYARQTVGGVHL